MSLIYTVVVDSFTVRRIAGPLTPAVKCPLCEQKFNNRDDTAHTHMASV